MTPARVLILNGSATQSLLLKHLIEQRGFRADCVDTLPAAAAALAPTLGATGPESGPPDAILVDQTIVGPDGVAELRRHSSLPAIILTGTARIPPGLSDIHTIPARDADSVAEAVQALLKRREEPPTASDIFSRARILIVDDSVTYREFLRLELTEEGCGVTVARNADEAIRALSEATFDTVIIDLVMPGVSGTALCQTFDRFRRRRGLFFQILILTSQEGDEQLRASLNAGADDFVGKSRPLEIFKLRLMALLRRKHLMEDTLRLRMPNALPSP